MHHLTAVREAGPDDLGRVVGLGVRFHAYSPYADIPLDRDAFAAFALRMMEEGVIFLSEDGMIGGVLSPLYFNPAVVSAAELFWWAPSGGRALREAFEAWARAKGAQCINFSGLVDARAKASERLFRAAGYRPTETGYLKRI